MIEEKDFLALSALQHFSFCERQCALIHLEQVWVENRLTAQGRTIHEQVHQEKGVSRGKLRVEHGISLCSSRLGITGKADVVEYHRSRLNGKTLWQPYPVEYKRGRPKKNSCDKIQLCAQALCLEEMSGLDIPKGALYYGKTRHRMEIIFDRAIREETERTVQALHCLIRSRKTPKAVYCEKKCERCSLLEVCLPKTTGQSQSVWHYLNRMIK